MPAFSSTTARLESAREVQAPAVREVRRDADGGREELHRRARRNDDACVGVGQQLHSSPEGFFRSSPCSVAAFAVGFGHSASKGRRRLVPTVPVRSARPGPHVATSSFPSTGACGAGAADGGGSPHASMAPTRTLLSKKGEGALVPTSTTGVGCVERSSTVASAAAATSRTSSRGARPGLPRGLVSHGPPRRRFDQLTEAELLSFAQRRHERLDGLGLQRERQLELRLRHRARRVQSIRRVP